MCKGKSSTQTKASLVFVKYGIYGATPTMHVQGQIKFKWACLIKHLADADIPNARLSAKSKLNSNMCLLEGIWTNIENTIQRCKPKSEVVELVDYNTIKQPRTMCNAKYQPKPQAASFFLFFFFGEYQI